MAAAETASSAPRNSVLSRELLERPHSVLGMLRSLSALRVERDA